MALTIINGIRLRAGEVLSPAMAREMLKKGCLRPGAGPASSGILPPTVTRKELLTAAHTEARVRIAENLAAARGFYAAGRRAEAAPLIEGALGELKTVLALGVADDDPLLSYYYAAKLMGKFLNVPDNAGVPQAGQRRVVQVLVLDAKRQAVLLQRRGPFKRMFADTFCVSANAKLKGDEPLPAARAVKDEVGLDIDQARVAVIGSPDQYGNHLTSCNFYAFSPAEEEALLAAAAALKNDCRSADDVMARYNPRTRALEVFTTNPLTGQVRLAQVVERVRAASGLPPLFAFSDTDTNSLVAYQLNESEEAVVRSLGESKRQARAAAAAQLAAGASGGDLKALDSDEMHFVPWLKVRCDATARPEEFTLVLTGAYFPNDSVWAALGFTLPFLIDVDDPAAALSCVSGGKGSNLHLLRRMPKQGFYVLDTLEVTTLAYEAVVLADRGIRAEIELLDRTADRDEAMAIAGRIRTKIGALEIPAWLVQLIDSAFRRLGGDVVIRSSATSEDLKEHQAAGQADSCLHRTDLPAVLADIKKVWASLFNDGFVAYRNSIGLPHGQSRMSALLEEFVDPLAAGVIFSFDQTTGRPGYRISAQPGVGVGVVDGVGLADRWFVGLLADCILSRDIPLKTVCFRPLPGGGIGESEIMMSGPSLPDRLVLDLARAARQVHRHYAHLGLADDVDLEYVVDKRERIVILQARAKRMQKSVDAEGRTMIRIRTVDERRLPPDAVFVQLDGRSETAVQGAVTGLLQLDPDRQPGHCLPGRILVTHHTNNDYNAVFGSLLGVITTDGDQTSHASEHAFEKKIPCVVGSLGALERLKSFDGRLVTFDAGRQRVYLGAQPIIEEERTLSAWLIDERAIAGFVDEGSRHENVRPWEISKRKRPRVFVEDPECHCRMRSGAYSVFHVDAFYRAWDRQTEIMNAMFAGRRPWELVPQARQIKAIGGKHQLVHIVEDNDPKNVYRFLMGVAGFGVADLENLFAARLDGFRRFAAFARSLARLDASNVRQLIDELLNIFSWMHFGFWLDSVVEEFAFEQLRYISNEGSFHKVLREEAVADLPLDYRVDPLNPALPAGKILNLTREREKEASALLATVRGEPRLREVIAAGDTAALAAEFPGVLATVERWSERYKLRREDFDVLSDTGEYLADLRRRLANDSSPGEETLVPSDAKLKELAGQVLAQYPEIKKVLTVSKLQFPLREDAHHLIVPLQRLVARQMLEAARPFVPAVLGRPEDVFRLALEEFAALLQESDPHYLSLSFERWPLLLAAEQELKKCWTVNKSDLADLTGDVAGLWTELTFENGGKGYLDDRGFLQDEFWALTHWQQMRLSPAFEPVKEKVFLRLRRPLTGLPAGLRAFEAATDKAVGMMETQSRAATVPGVKEYYRAEQARLKQRVADLKKKLLGGDDHGGQ